MKEAPYLKTNRLILRPLSPDDAENLIYLLHPNIQKDAGPYMPHSLDDLPKHIERIISDTTWLIMVNENKVIGDIGVSSKKGNETGEMAWYLDPEYCRMGYATEAGSAVIHYMFSTLNFCKLTAKIDSNNISSRKLAEKLGFTIEHIKYDSDLYGKKADVCFYSIHHT